MNFYRFFVLYSEGVGEFVEYFLKKMTIRGFGFAIFSPFIVERHIFSLRRVRLPFLAGYLMGGVLAVA